MSDKNRTTAPGSRVKKPKRQLPDQPSGRRPRSRLRWAVPALAVLFLAGFLIYQSLFLDVLAGVSFSRVYLDRNGELLNIFLTGDQKYRVRTDLGDFPPELVRAVLLQEDRYFYGHAGVNPGALIRAGWETYVKRDRRVGASTITMQLARLRYGLYTRNLPGKLRQIFRAVFLEICLNKQEILEAYLNLAPCGGNIEGFPAAAWYYFNKDIKDLTLGEILTLAVIPQNPLRRSPRDGVPRELLEARSLLFDVWLEEHPEDRQFRAEMAMPPAITRGFPRRTLHLTEYLNLRFPGAGAETGGKPLGTTVNRDYQDLCEAQLAFFLEQNRSWGVENGSLLLADHTTMEVLAAVGSADYFNDEIRGQVNGTAAKRSPGSTLKPFIYALALEQGLIHPEKMLKDTPVGFNEYTPDNYLSEFKGPIKAWDALVDSRNIPAIQLARDIANPDLYDFLKASGVAGLKPREHYGLSLVLGSAEVTMLELAELYGILANRGIRRDLRFFSRGEPVSPGEVRGTRLLSQEAAWITLRMLERNPPADTHLEGRRAVPVAYKTGTSIGFKDAWSVAVFDRFILCVWIGNFSGEGNSAFLGRQTASPLLFRIVDALLGEIGPESYPQDPRPRTVSQIPVCAVSGDIPGEDCPQTVSTWFIPGVSPINRCNIHRPVYIDTRTGYRTDETQGEHIRREIREFWPTDLQAIFNQAGLPRLEPPPYPPEEDSGLRIPRGFPPAVISPLDNTTYVVRPGRAAQASGRAAQAAAGSSQAPGGAAGRPPEGDLILQAAADQDAGDLFWFANSLFLGRAKGGETLQWTPEPGDWNITVVDSRGRSAGIRIRVAASGE